MKRYCLALVTLLPAVASAQPGITTALMDSYLTGARVEAPGLKAFSPQRGQELFLARHGEVSCASCHTENPKAVGKHMKTTKVIEPLAPAANPERLSDPAKVEKWFKRNCNDVLQRACTDREKGDFLAWLISIR